ncbi:3-keto-disaccharide hydrolase [Azomonas macrocytogenes]|uniref:3-keto-alpha-glucoside-1,2-lyase/3-keto-2-hydroxy-glucal hydratase domain-containing protein n=1 Tax=Azomonas macrocytogenes TaxID=69962 RepID=A0A839T1G0_AZOMA|nr:DUF1080 domain-containing protein [Azomonas macrocytogenes]MBB3103381.1 hypothetical protein [Azomonas macrocytogenes]
MVSTKTWLDAHQWRAWQGQQFPEASWRYAGEELWAIAGAPQVGLISRECYRDFAFRFEFRLPAGGHSGVLYRVDEAAQEAWQSGPEMQLLDDARHPAGGNPATSNGALCQLLPPWLATDLREGHFLRGQVIVRGNRVEHWLKDRQVLAYDLDDPALRQCIAHSEFGDFPDFARAPQGHLVLQHHGDAVCFRRLSVELLG